MIHVVSLFALFASALSVNKLILRDLPPILFVGLRMFSASMILGIYHWATGNTRLQWQSLRPHLISLACIALSTMYIPSILKAYGLKYMVSSKSALIGSLDPFITALYGYLIWGNRLRWNHLCGILLGFCGVFVLIYIQDDALAEQWWIISPAELAALGSVCISRLGWIAVQHQLRTYGYHPTELNTILMGIGGACSLITAWLMGEWEMIPNTYSWNIITLLAYTVIFGNIFAYAGYGLLLRTYSVTFVSLAGLLIPLFVHLYGPVILDEALSSYFFIALGLVGSGLWLFNWPSAQSSVS